MEYAKTNEIMYFSEIDFDTNNSPKNRNEIRKDIEDLLNIRFYFYEETKIEDGGMCNPIIRKILLSSDLTDIEYIEIFCHELCHIKYFTSNERFTQYKTWETLYNSDKYRPVANYILYKMSRRMYYKEYDCYCQILEYLKEN
jgi:hypothetical protein